MDLKNFLDRDNKKERDLYWALVLEPGWIQAGIWEIVNAKAEVVSISPPAAWETENELVGAADTALSAAVQNLPQEAGEPAKTVFGVPPSWVSGGQIKEEHLDKIKKVCAELSLEPTGFVVIPEAVSYLIKSEEGSPLNAVVVGIGGDTLDVAVFKLGNLAGTASVGRSVSLVEDISEGLSRFGSADSLPSRFIIYDGKEGEMEEARQALINVNWEEYEKIKFLHTPKVEILTPERKVLATCLAGASEIANVSIIGTMPKEAPQAAPKDLGFVVGEDIALAPQEVPGEVPKFSPFNFFDKAKEKGSLFLSSLRLPKPSFLSGSPLLIGGGFFLALIIIGFILWWFFPKATVTVFVSPKKLEENIEVSLSPNAGSSDFSRGILPAEVLKAQASGDKTKATSGTKTIGDKAKGTVKIENGTDKNINLPAGTILTSAGNLQFTLSDTASVSAALSPANPGTVTADVTAADIGSEYNLAKDESFKVANNPKADVDAVATSDFSGGSSRQISAVSPEDQQSLEEDLTGELSQKAKDELASSLSSDKYFVEDSLVGTASGRTFSNKVGDEASNLKLSLNLSVSALAVDKKNLTDLARGALKGKVPSGFVLREDQIDFVFKGTGKKEGSYTFDLTVTANFLPEIKPDEIAKAISGKYPSFAENYLKGVPGFSRAEITIKPRLPGRLGTLPHIAKRISVEVEAER